MEEAAKTLSWETWALPLIFTLLIGALGFFLKRWINEVKESQERIHQETREANRETNERIDKLEEKLQATIEQLPYQYTLREDFIRSVSGLERKLDKILDKMDGK